MVQQPQISVLPGQQLPKTENLYSLVSNSEEKLIASPPSPTSTQPLQLSLHLSRLLTVSQSVTVWSVRPSKGFIYHFTKLVLQTECLCPPLIMQQIHMLIIPIGRNRDSDIENRLVDIVRGRRERVGQTDCSFKTCILPCVKQIASGNLCCRMGRRFKREGTHAYYG